MNYDRRSNMRASSVNAPAKKDGAGGGYTWGSAMDGAEYEPMGMGGTAKVIVAPAQYVVPPTMVQAAVPVVHLTDQQQFPGLGQAPVIQAATTAAWGQGPPAIIYQQAGMAVPRSGVECVAVRNLAGELLCGPMPLPDTLLELELVVAETPGIKHGAFGLVHKGCELTNVSSLHRVAEQPIELTCVRDERGWRVIKRMLTDARLSHYENPMKLWCGGNGVDTVHEFLTHAYTRRLLEELNFNATERQRWGKFLWDHCTDSLESTSSTAVRCILRVDQKLGAGVDLIARPYGMMVCDVCPKPGQPDLIRGDVITEINGVSLIVVRRKSMANLIGEHFRDGASLVVERRGDFDTAYPRVMGRGDRLRPVSTDVVIARYRDQLDR